MKATPTKNKRSKPSTKLMLAIKRAENNRVAQNAAARTFQKSMKIVEELCRKERITQSEVKCMIDGKMQPVEFGFDNDAVTVTLDIAKLRRLVSDETFAKCLVAQVGLVKQNAGTRILDKVKTETKLDKPVFYCRVKK